MTPTEKLLDRLEAVKPNGRDRWMARCPAHPDKSPSLSIRDTDERILIHCFAGCGAADVVAAVGLTLADLFPDGAKAHHIKGKKQPRRNPREVLAAVSHALTAITLTDRKVCEFLPLTNDEREAVDKAIRVLETFEREARP